jgi:hypothetical protein
MKNRYSAPRGILAAVLLLVCLAGHQVQAQSRYQATIVLNNGQQASGMVRYLPASRSYELKSGPVTREVRAAEVERIDLAEQPEGLEAALANVRAGRYASAIPVLSKIVEDYAMFGPDIKAGGALMKSYLETNRASEALKAGETMVRRSPDLAKKPEFASVYWEVLLANERMASLRTAIDEAVSSGSRELAAFGLIRRGDMEKEAGRTKEALVDGYLRVALMFRDVPAAQPEALFKAIQAHEELNEVTYAERWRQRLLSTFPTSEFAQRLR